MTSLSTMLHAQTALFPLRSMHAMHSVSHAVSSQIEDLHRVLAVLNRQRCDLNRSAEHAECHRDRLQLMYNDTARDADEKRVKVHSLEAVLAETMAQLEAKKMLLIQLETSQEKLEEPFAVPLKPADANGFESTMNPAQVDMFEFTSSDQYDESVNQDHSLRYRGLPSQSHLFHISTAGSNDLQLEDVKGRNRLQNLYRHSTDAYLQNDESCPREKRTKLMTSKTDTPSRFKDAGPVRNKRMYFKPEDKHNRDRKARVWMHRRSRTSAAKSGYLGQALYLKSNGFSLLVSQQVSSAGAVASQAAVSSWSGSPFVSSSSNFNLSSKPHF
ncbi:hypothetical protein BJ741DRAFT_609862 [Chytriomyces cf. hyalinus JEL632]|nr:hypothetical protein BJ741DRAFT_609862 [Chytriomyces cf. hyalinus JEL632]